MNGKKKITNKKGVKMKEINITNRKLVFEYKNGGFYMRKGRDRTKNISVASNFNNYLDPKKIIPVKDQKDGSLVLYDVISAYVRH